MEGNNDSSQDWGNGMCLKKTKNNNNRPEESTGHIPSSHKQPERYKTQAQANPLDWTFLETGKGGVCAIISKDTAVGHC